MNQTSASLSPSLLFFDQQENQAISVFLSFFTIIILDQQENRGPIAFSSMTIIGLKRK